MKQNPCPVVGEVAKPTGIGLDELNGTVEPFRTGVTDSVLAEVEQPFFVASEHLDDLFDWLQLAAHRVVRPCLEEAFGSTLVAIAPELAEVLLDAPGPAGLQVELVQGPKRDRFSAAAVGILLEPCPFGTSKWRRARLRQSAVLLLSHRIYRLAEVLGDVKLVVHDVGLGQTLPGCTHVRRPHIHGHRLDRQALRRRERLQQTHRRFKLSLWHQVQYPRAVNVGQDTGVGVALVRTLLIDAKVRDLFFSAPQHASLHGADHDGVDRAPGQSGESAYGLRRGTGLKQFDDKPCHQGRNPAITLSPWNGQLFDCAVAVFELGHAGFDDGLELACVQVTPLTFAPTVDVRSLGRISGVCPHLTFLQNNFYHHPLVCQRKVNLFDRPRRLQSKKLLIQCGVFHTNSDNFKKLDFLAASKNSQ